MQLLEDKDIVNYGDMAQRIAVLREQVKTLMSNHAKNGTTLVPDNQFAEANEKLLADNNMLKEQLIEMAEFASTKSEEQFLAEINDLKKKLLEKNNTGVDSINLLEENSQLKKKIEAKNTSDNTKNKELLLEIIALKKQLLEKEEPISGSDELLQENLMLKKQIADREKTIKELDFKLEMFRLAKSLREGAGINTKSEELRNIITEYIKEIDKNIASLNID